MDSVLTEESVRTLSLAVIVCTSIQLGPQTVSSPKGSHHSTANFRLMIFVSLVSLELNDSCVPFSRAIK